MKTFWGIAFVIAAMTFHLPTYAAVEQPEVGYNAPEVPVRGIELDYDTLEVVEGKQYFIRAGVLPHNASNQELRYSSSNTDVASVNSKSGRIRAIAPGECYIKAVTSEGGYEKECRVVVKAIIPVEDITFESESLTLTECTRGYVCAKVLPGNATDQKILYSSSDTEIAEVGRSTGVVKAKKEGQCIITAESQDGDIKKSVTVHVMKWVPVESVSLQQKMYSMTVGESSFAYAVASPANATDMRIRYVSSDSSVAKVSSISGMIKAISAGECTVKAYSVDGKKEDSCRITVKDPYVKVTEVEILNVPEKIYPGDTAVLEARILPENATRKEVKWESSDEQIVKVSEDGTIKALGVGTAVIRATSVDGAVGSRTIEVLPIAVQNILLDKEDVEVVKGEVVSVGYHIIPDNATNKAVSVILENDEILSIMSDTGEKNISFLAKAVGTQTVIFKTEDGNKQAACKIQVVAKKRIPVQDIVLESEQYEIGEGESTAIQYHVIPEDSNEQISFKSSDPEVVSIGSGSGLIRGLKEGQAEILIENKSKSVRRKCRVNVKAREVIQSLVLSDVELCLTETEKAQLTVHTVPEASTQKVIFESSDNSIATVGKRTGVIKALSTGECVITASVEGGPEAQCKITVTPAIPVEKIVLDSDALYMKAGNRGFINAAVLPDNATQKTLYFESSNENVISINKGTGIFHAGIPGESVITVMTADKKITAQCLVTVYVP